MPNTPDAHQPPDGHQPSGVQPREVRHLGDGRWLVDGTPVEVRRSSRRRRTVGARLEAGTVVVLLPASLGRRVERDWVVRMAARVVGSQQRRRVGGSDEELMARARALSERHLAPVVGHEVVPRQVRWVTNQNQRWGSCTPETGVIRLSHRLQQMPDWVVDHVLLHELAHLVEADHGPRFRALLATDPRGERAQGFLDGWSAATGAGLGADPD